LKLKCSGIVGIVPGEGSDWKIWLLCTILEEIEGFPSPDTIDMEGVRSEANRQTDQVNGHQQNGASETLDCVVVGSGYGGLCVAGRLKALGLNYLIIDQEAKVGDNWLDRYDSARCEYAALCKFVVFCVNDCLPQFTHRNGTVRT
jgi:hypothetical protein